MEVVFSPCINQ